MTQQTLTRPTRRSELDTSAALHLRSWFTGATHLPGTEAYDELRKPFLPILDPWPALIVEASGAADVRTAIAAARQFDLPLGIQATGHGIVAPADGGLLLRTSRMSTVLIDPDRRIARTGPGARWRDVIAAAEPFGLAPLSGSAPS